MSADMRDDPDASSSLCDFLDLWLEDRAAGRSRGLADYLRRFPGHEERVAREFLALEADADGAHDLPAAEAAGHVLGHYRILERLGSGGQGTVFLAEDVRLRRHVALKILDGSLGGLPATRLARLRREAEALSRLDHPRLCALYDVDLAGERPYFAMRYVAGETLARRIERARTGAGGEDAFLSRLPATAAEVGSVLAFVEQAARAVHVAHEAGIVHRDLKPGNLMIDRQSEPVVLDFGLARDLTAEAATITMTGDAFGTLSYMSPEQLSGTGEIDRRADVYSLGVTLYECLTLRRPIEAATRESLLRGIMAGEREDPRALNPAIPRDLGVVLACALDVDPARRYATALAFAEDLRRVREHEPILARPAGFWRLTRRWARRHPAAFAGSVATFTLLLAGLAVTVALLARVTREQAQTRREQTKLLALRQAYLAKAIGGDKPALALRVGIEAARHEPHPEIRNILYELLDRCYEERTLVVRKDREWWPLGWEPVVDANGRAIVAHTAGGIAAFDLANGARTDLRASAAADKPPLAEPARLAITHDRRRLVSAGNDGVLEVWDLSAQPAVVESRATPDTEPTAIDLSRNGRRVATGTKNGGVAVFAIGSDTPTARGALPGRTITNLSFDPGGTMVAAAGFRSAPGGEGVGPGAAVFDAATGRTIVDLDRKGRSGLWTAWSASGDRLAVALDATVAVFRTSDWTEEAALPHGDLVRWIGFHPGSGRLVTGSRDGVCVFDPGTWGRVAAIGDFRDRSVIRGAFSPDGSELAVVSWDQTASIVSCRTWTESRKLRGMGRPRGVCWSPDASRLVTTDETNEAHVWFPGEREHLPVLRGHGGRVVTAAFLPDGKQALTGSLDGVARLFDAASGKQLREMAHGAPLAAAKPCAEGRRVATIGGGRVTMWETATGSRLGDLASGSAAALDAWPSGRDGIVVAYDDGCARAWAAAGPGPSLALQGHRTPVLCAAFHEGRGLAATGDASRTVRVWDLASGRCVSELTFPEPVPQPPGQDLSRVFALCFDPSGARVFAACEDLRVRLWDVASGRLEAETLAPTTGSFALDPKGRWIMTAAKWTGRLAFHELGNFAAPWKSAPLQDSNMIAAIAFSPSGSHAMAASKDGTVRFWNVDGLLPHAELDARCGMLLDAAFSPDGASVIVAGSDGTARIWPVDPLPVAERHCPLSPRAFEFFREVVDQAVFR